MQQILKEPEQVSEWALAVLVEDILDGGNMEAQATNTSKHRHFWEDILK